MLRILQNKQSSYFSNEQLIRNTYKFYYLLLDCEYIAHDYWNNW